MIAHVSHIYIGEAREMWLGSDANDSVQQARGDIARKLLIDSELDLVYVVEHASSGSGNVHAKQHVGEAAQHTNTHSIADRLAHNTGKGASSDAFECVSRITVAAEAETFRKSGERLAVHCGQCIPEVAPERCLLVRELPRLTTSARQVIGELGV